MDDFFDNVYIETDTTETDTHISSHLFVLSCKFLFDDEDRVSSTTNKIKRFLNSRLNNLLFKIPDISFSVDAAYTKENYVENNKMFNVKFNIDVYGLLEKSSVKELVDFLDMLLMTNDVFFRILYKANTTGNAYQLYNKFVILEYENRTTGQKEEYSVNNNLLYKSIIGSILGTDHEIIEEILWHSKIILNDYKKSHIREIILKETNKDSHGLYKPIKYDTVNSYGKYCLTKYGFEKLLDGMIRNDVTVMFSISPWVISINRLCEYDLYYLFQTQCEYNSSFDFYNKMNFTSFITQKTDDFEYDENNEYYIDVKSGTGIVDIYATAPVIDNRHMSTFFPIINAYNILKRNKKKICSCRRWSDGSKEKEFEGLYYKDVDADKMDIVICISDFFDKETRKIYSLNVRLCGSIYAVENAINEIVS